MRTIALLTLATCLACNDQLDVFELDSGVQQNNADSGGPDTGPLDTGTPDSGIGVAVIPADILFIVDNSGTMVDEQENLAANFSRFVDQTFGAADYQIGVVTADVSDGAERAGDTSFTFSSTAPFILTNFSSSDCRDVGIPHGCFRGPNPTTRLITSSLTREQQLMAFAENVRVGTCGAGVERSLDAMLLALEQTGPGGCNEGFLRPYANLVVVIISDEDDGSERPIEEIVDALGTYKPFHQIRVATVVGSVGGEPSSCRTGSGAECGSLCENMPPSGSLTPCTANCTIPGESCIANQCNNPQLQYWSACASCAFYNAPDCCSALPGGRYIDFARLVEQRVHEVRQEFPIADCLSLGTRIACLAETICQENFGDTLARIALELVLVDR